MPMKRPDVLTADFEAELVVYVPADNKAHHLDAGLSLVLSSCDGATATADFVAEVATGTSRSTTDIESWLETSLASLAELGMLAESGD